MKIAAFAVLASLSAAGCAATTPPDILPVVNAADPQAGLRPAPYQPVVANYNHRMPVEPENWRRMNERLSPANRESGS
jgi:hypothetical protein